MIRGNSVEFRGGVGTPFIQQTQPAETTVSGNTWDAAPDWAALVAQRLQSR